MRFHRWRSLVGVVRERAVKAGVVRAPAPQKQGEAIGSLSNRVLITTQGGGGSEYIGWDYNSTANWTCTGRCLVEDLHVGDWYPAGRESTPKP